jgi:hypothetical protein
VRTARPAAVLIAIASVVVAFWYAAAPERTGPGSTRDESSEEDGASTPPRAERSRRLSRGAAVAGEASRGATTQAAVVAAQNQPTPDAPAGALPSAAAPPPNTGLAVDASGNFKPDARTVELVESFLSSDEPPERSIARARAEIAERLEPPAETQALEFLNRYVDYRRRGIELGLNKDVSEDFTPRFAQLRSLRREFFGIEDAQRMYGDEEKAANLALREHEILSDPDLSDEERARRLDELHNPPAEKRE